MRLPGNVHGNADALIHKVHVGDIAVEEDLQLDQQQHHACQNGVQAFCRVEGVPRLIICMPLWQESNKSKSSTEIMVT
ncbi:hypothetical protein PR048_012818 [Dryococelus australis]|uniref:Uncharacterized protein n=1 Tax=Dryococelus australis TaxID=614101 RepID=A0ABQ9HQG8_9NEOP|nr:hypothetical protein PR048_012818 [Dryococelus australis]